MKFASCVRVYLFSLCVGSVCSAAAAQTPDAKELVLQSLGNYEKAWRAGMEWSYRQNDVITKAGKPETVTSDIVPLEGTPYERIVAKNGQPLSSEEQQKEDRKFEKERRYRQNETQDQRAARIEKYEKERAFLKDIPNAYDFAPAGTEEVAGRPAWAVTLTPRPGFVPATPHGEILKHVEGKLLIDQRDLQWARAEAHVVGTISVGLILARIGPGAHITIDMGKVAPGLWMPSAMSIQGTARVLLLDNRSLNEQLTFDGYHRGNEQVAQSPGVRRPSGR